MSNSILNVLDKTIGFLIKTSGLEYERCIFSGKKVKVQFIHYFCMVLGSLNNVYLYQNQIFVDVFL